MLNYHVRQSPHLNAGVPDDGEEEVAVVWNYGSPTGVFSNSQVIPLLSLGVTATETDDTARATDFLRLVDEVKLDGSHSQQCVAVTGANSMDHSNGQKKFKF